MTTATTNKGTKTQRIVYWITTSIIFLFDGLGALGSNTKIAIDGMHHAGFMSDAFRWELGIGKVLGGFFLILPFVSKRLKEWAYVGFGISTITACVVNFAAGDEMGKQGGIMALAVFGILVTSYIMFHKTYGKGIYQQA